MTWGPMYMYYHCPKCDVMGVYEKDGVRQTIAAFSYEIVTIAESCAILGVN